jgi:hypothetical protein
MSVTLVRMSDADVAASAAAAPSQGTPSQATETRPSPAGMYDYYLGGTTNSSIDRAAAEQVKRFMPEIVDAAWANRGFLQRAVRRMTSQWGIRQFIDIGAGLPTQSNTHEVAAEEAPGCRVVYVDNDPTVFEAGREILAGTRDTAVIMGDLRSPDEILNHPRTRELIDFAQPVGLLMVAVVHFVPDEDDPLGLLARYRDAIPSGSYLALSSVTSDHQDRPSGEGVGRIYAASASPPVARTKDEIRRFFAGWDIVAPYDGADRDVIFIGQWGADDPVLADSEGSRILYAGVARKP